MTTPDQFKKQIGIGTPFAGTEILTPTTQSVGSHIKTSTLIPELLRQNPMPAQEITPELSAFADLCLQHYNETHARIREGYLAISDSAYKDYGLHVKVIGDVTLSPVNTKGRWFMNFRTTHVFAEGDTNSNVNIFCFDTHSNDLDEPSPERKFHYLVGEKSGKKQIIGSYPELNEQSKGNLSKTLQREGWENIGELWLMDLDR